MAVTEILFSGFPWTRCQRRRLIEKYSKFENVGNLRFSVMMWIMTGLPGRYLWCTREIWANDHVKNLASLGFWHHHSHWADGCFTNNARVLFELSYNVKHYLIHRTGFLLSSKHELCFRNIITFISLWEYSLKLCIDAFLIGTGSHNIHITFWHRHILGLIAQLQNKRTSWHGLFSVSAIYQVFHLL